MPLDASHAGPIRFSAPRPAIAGMRQGALLVMGGARCLWSDLDQLDGGVQKWPGEIMAVNDIGAHFQGPLHHWATLHSRYMPGWRAYRQGHCYGDTLRAVTHALDAAPDIDFAWRMTPHGGNGGLFAALVGLLLGYDRIVLAGIPCDGQGHYFDPPNVAHSGFGRDDLVEWEFFRDAFFGDRVRSLSGKTREILGAPQ